MAMAGRILHLPRPPARQRSLARWAALALVLALAVVLTPSLRSDSVLTSVLTPVVPASSGFEHVGDEVLAAQMAVAVAPQMRIRLLPPGDLSLALLVTAVAALATTASVLHGQHHRPMGRSLVPIPSAPGRSPPRTSRSRR
jgi:hypothetical protein